MTSYELAIILKAKNLITPTITKLTKEFQTLSKTIGPGFNKAAHATWTAFNVTLQKTKFNLGALVQTAQYAYYRLKNTKLLSTTKLSPMITQLPKNFGSMTLPNQVAALKNQHTMLQAAVSPVANPNSPTSKGMKLFGVRLATMMSTAGAKIRVMAGGFGALGLGIIYATSQFEVMHEQTIIAFSAVSGGIQEATNRFNQLAVLSQHTQFGIGEIALASNRLQQFGFSASEADAQILSISNALASIPGADQGALANITGQLAQMKSIGFVTGQEISALTSAGIPAIQMLSDAMHIAPIGVERLLSRGVLRAGPVIDALKAEITKKYGDLADAQSNSLGNVLRRLTETLQQGFGAILAPWFNILRNVLMFTNSQLFYMLNWFRLLPTSMKTVIGDISGLTLTLGGLTLGMVAFGLGVQGLASAFEGLGIAFGVFRTIALIIAGVLSGPIILAILLLVGTIAVLYLAWTNNWLGIKGTLESVWGNAGIQFIFGLIASGLGELVLAATLLKLAWDSNFLGIRTIVTTAWGFIQPIFNTISQVFLAFATGGPLGVLLLAWQTNFLGIRDITNTVWNGIVTFFNTIIRPLPGIIYSWIQTLPDQIAALWVGIQSDATNDWNAITTFFNTYVQPIVGMIAGWFSSLPSDIEAYWQGIQNDAINDWTAITTFFNTYVLPLTTGIIGWFANIPSAIGGYWSGIQTDATNDWNSIITFFNNTVSPFANTIIGWFTGIPDALSRAWTQINTDATSAWRNIVNNANSWGSDIMRGIYRGITSISIPVPEITMQWSTRTGPGGIQIPWPDIGLGYRFESLSSLFGLAQGGTTTQSGMYQVGEFGKEIVNLPGGSSVVPLSQTQGNAAVNHFHMEGATIIGYNDFESMVVKALQTAQRRGRATAI